MVNLHGDAADKAGGGRADLAGVFGIGLGVGALGGVTLTMSPKS